jgi:hypothetical protein
MINRVILAGIFSFPSGEAAASRIRNLAQGFKELVDDTTVISMYQKEESSVFTGKGEYLFENKSISYVSHTQFIKETSNILERTNNRFNFFFNHRLLARKIVASLKGDESEMLFLYGRSYMFLSFLLKLIKQKGYKTKLVFDVVEPPRSKQSKLEYLMHPFVWDSALVFYKLLKKFDACTFISTKLQMDFGGQLKNHVIIPSVVYSKKLTPNLTKSLNQKFVRIGYLGALLSKDFPEIMMKFCIELNQTGYDFRITIIGRFNSFIEGRTWKQTICDSSFKEKVEFYSNPSDLEKEKILDSIDFLFMFRKPEMLQAYTFPTRVVELLSKDKLIIVNNFGDFNLYFKHKINAWVVSDSSELSIENDLSFFMNQVNYNNTVNESKKMLKDEFNATVNAYKILKIFN